MPGLIISEILNMTASLQGGWAKRSNAYWLYKRTEDNIFSLASTVFILNEITAGLAPKCQQEVEKIKENIKPLYINYKNKDGRETYNFYQTRPSRHFPNGYFMQYLDHFRLPDDIDDTALITLSLDPPLSDIKRLKALTESFAQTFADGKTIYNTWYGKNMPKEQDVCTILNFFYLIYHYDLPTTKTDEDSFRFLTEKIDLITSRPFEIARHYANPALILYHYARFMGRFSSPLDSSKSKIIGIIYNVLEAEPVFMNRLILETSLLKLGEKRPPLPIEDLTFKNFYTFIGAPLAPFPGKIVRKLSALNATQMFWDSEIHNKALVAEYIVWSKYEFSDR